MPTSAAAFHIDRANANLASPCDGSAYSDWSLRFLYVGDENH